MVTHFEHTIFFIKRKQDRNEKTHTKEKLKNFFLCTGTNIFIHKRLSTSKFNLKIIYKYILLLEELMKNASLGAAILSFLNERYLCKVSVPNLGLLS